MATPTFFSHLQQVQFHFFHFPAHTLKLHPLLTLHDHQIHHNSPYYITSTTVIPIMKILPLLLFFPLVLILFFPDSASGFGSMGPIAASYGPNSVFCAIDASGRQEVICWGDKANISTSLGATPTSSYPVDVPPMAALSGGGGFLCGITANTSQAYCWHSQGSSSDDLVPATFRQNAYFHIAAGESHVCALRGPYYGESYLGKVDCWDIYRRSNVSFTSNPTYLDETIGTLDFQKIVSGNGFSCGVVKEGGISCWGLNATRLGLSAVQNQRDFISLASGSDTVCGVQELSNETKCWGMSLNGTDSPAIPPSRIRLVSLAAGAQHFCGIRQDDHGIECWGNFNSSLVPKGYGFLAIASSDFVSCGIRETDLVLDCWFASGSPPLSYDPPLQLCSPGLCSTGPCGEGKFAFNASFLNEPDLTSLCVRKDLKICSPCGYNCSDGYFPSSPCTENADRICTACSLCQSSSCREVCKLHTSPEMKQKNVRQFHQLLLIIVSSASGFLLILVAWFVLPRVIASKDEEGNKKSCAFSCMSGKTEPEVEAVENHPAVVVQCPGMAQVFRLSELKDATNGFKEFNELGRGSNGFVYKAVLPDGRHVAVKRANAATIIHTNSRDFEMELEILCSVRHSNIVNLLGYCAEMGERILVYEFMPHGTLDDHIHGGLSPLNWLLRLKIAMQAAKGLEYLHNEVAPPIAHRDLKSSKILLDGDWGARIADFAVLASNESDITQDRQNDVYSFGIVLLEILSGRKAHDADCHPPSIVDWALPLIRDGKAAAIIDRYVALPRNVEPLLRLAEVSELALREDPSKRPGISDLALVLEQLVKDGLIM